MRESAEAYGVYLDVAPVEMPGAIETVNRYHTLLRLAYERIRGDNECQTSEQECLCIAAFSVTCAVGRGGLCRARFIFGAISQPPRTLAEPTKLESPRLIDRVMKYIAREQTKS